MPPGSRRTPAFTSRQRCYYSGARAVIEPRPYLDAKETSVIYEIRTYNVKPGAVAEWEGRFAEAYSVREKYSPLGGMWHTDIGPLNQVVHIWQYENLQER